MMRMMVSPFVHPYSFPPQAFLLNSTFYGTMWRFGKEKRYLRSMNTGLVAVLLIVIVLLNYASVHIFGSPWTGKGGGEVIGRKWRGTAEDVLAHVKEEGWASSAIEAKKDQGYAGAPCFYQGDCSAHGENLLGRCFCFPGWTGSKCDVADTKEQDHPCTN